MRQIRRDISTTEKDTSGWVSLIAEVAEDMWHAYNLIAEKDYVKASTMRKVQNETATGSSTSHRVHTTVTIQVEAIDFDTTACHLRLKGKNVAENKFIKMGAYHTIDLELNRSFTIQKASWDVVALERLDLACDPTKSADVGAVIMQEGLANVCLVTPSMTTVVLRVEVSIPRKRRGNCTQHDKALVRFYDSVLQGMLRHFDFTVIKCIVIASPGFVKDQFYDYMFDFAVKTDNKLLFDIKPKFVLVHSSSGHKYALKEVLADPSVASRLADTKAAGEVKALEAFFQMLQTDQDRAFYGVKHVEFAADREAVDVLMLSDELFRAQDVAQRKRYVSLVEKVKETGAEVKIFSSLHVSGEQLGQLTGVAAILRFPLEFNDDDDDSSDDDDNAPRAANGSASSVATANGSGVSRGMSSSAVSAADERSATPSGASAAAAAGGNRC